MAAISMLLIAVASLLLHSMLLYSPQDIHFKAREVITSRLEPQVHSLRPPAKRVVLFTVQGETANDVYSLNDNGETKVPFIRHVITKKGRWGIAYPPPNVTIPRPFLTGSGWSEEEEGDNLLQSTNLNWIWCTSNDTLRHWSSVNTFTYNIEASINSSLTQWVVQDVEHLFLIRGNEASISDQLSQDKSLFYFSFGSVDLVKVDTAINNIVNLFESYYTDGKTAFIFTAVASSSQYEGLPFVAWGAGIKNPRSKHHSTLALTDSWSDHWRLDSLERLDLQLIDIAPLVSVLIGVRIPLHSHGILPIDFVHYNKEFYAEASFSNALQLLELVRAKERSISSHSLPLFFRPYHKLTFSIQEDTKQRIVEYIRQRKLQEGLELSIKLMSLCKEAFNYFNTYHHLSLKSAITLMLISWIFYLITVLVRKTYDIEDIARAGIYFNGLWTIISCAVVCLLIWYQEMPLHCSVYFCVPVICLALFLNNKDHLLHTIYKSSRLPEQFYRSCLTLLVSVLIIEALVFSFYHSYSLSLVWIALSFWPLFCKLKRHSLHAPVYLSIMCITMAAYISLPSLSELPIPISSLYNTSVALLVITVTLFLLSKPSIRYTLTRPGPPLCNSVSIFIFQVLIITIATVQVNTVIWEVCNAVQSHIGWVVIFTSALLLFVQPQSVIGRLLNLGLSFFTIFLIITSTNNEALFFVILCFLLHAWLINEERLIPDRLTSLYDGVVSYSTLQAGTLIPEESMLRSELVESIRRSVIVCVLVVTSLQYLTNERDYTNMLLLDASKLSLPMVAVMCCYNILLSLAHVKLQTGFLILTILFDVIALQFFFLIQVETGDDSNLIRFYASVGLALMLPLLLMITQLFTGLSIAPKKSIESLN